MEGCHIQVDSLSVHLKTENGLLHVLDNFDEDFQTFAGFGFSHQLFDQVDAGKDHQN